MFACPATCAGRIGTGRSDQPHGHASVVTRTLFGHGQDVVPVREEATARGQGLLTVAHALILLFPAGRTVTPASTVWRRPFPTSLIAGSARQ